MKIIIGINDLEELPGQAKIDLVNVLEEYTDDYDINFDNKHRFIIKKNKL